jgi:general secretion pathway protein I
MKTNFNTNRMRRCAGFTLLEVMVALAVLAFALAAGIKAASSNISNESYLETRTLANWVAMNKMTEMEVFNQWPSAGNKKRGTTIMAGHEWHWTVETTESTVLDPYKFGVATVKVRASEDDKQALATLISAYQLNTK